MNKKLKRKYKRIEGVKMNLCFLMGKIVSKIEFDFLIDNGKISKEISIARFNLQIDKENIVKIFVYNNFADIVYRELKLGDNIGIEGSLKTNGYIKLEKYIKMI